MCSLIDVNTDLLSAVHEEYNEGLSAVSIASKHNLSVEYVEDIVSWFKKQKELKEKLLTV